MDVKELMKKMQGTKSGGEMGRITGIKQTDIAGFVDVVNKATELRDAIETFKLSKKDADKLIKAMGSSWRHPDKEHALSNTQMDLIRRCIKIVLVGKDSDDTLKIFSNTMELRGYFEGLVAMFRRTI